MPAVSKHLFYNNVPSDITCNLLHPWTASCTGAFAYLFRNSIIGCSKFFIPIYVIQAIISHKKLKSKDYQIYFLKSYLRTMIYAVSFVCIFLGSNCLLSNCLGRVYYYNIALISGFFAGLPIYMESSDNRNLNTILFFNMAVEAVIRMLESSATISRSPLKDTGCFMICSAALMYLFKTQSNRPYNNFWFYSPIVKSDDKNINSGVCSHDNTCSKYIIKGLIKYFTLGYTVEIVKSILGGLNSIVKNPTIIRRILFNKNNAKFGLVTGGYVAIFRLITCLLYKFERKQCDYHFLIAGFFSGMTYIIRPNIQFGITAFTTVLQLLLQRTQKAVPISNAFTGLLFSVLNGFLLHRRFLFPETSPKYVKNMTLTCTNGVDSEIFKFVYGILFDGFFL